MVGGCRNLRGLLGEVLQIAVVLFMIVGETRDVGVEPIAVHQGDKHGACGLCGGVPASGLSKTHVPAKATGNDGEMRGLVRRYEDADSLPSVGLGRPADGGMWGWWFYEECNNRTGAFVEAMVEYAAVGTPLAPHYELDGKPYGENVAARAEFYRSRS